MDKTKERILKLCDIILTNEDKINFELTEEYIEEHISNNVNFTTDKYTIRYYVQEQIKKIYFKLFI